MIVVSMSCGSTCNSRMNFSWQELSYRNQFLTAFSVLPLPPLHIDKYGGANLAFDLEAGSVLLTPPRSSSAFKQHLRLCKPATVRPAEVADRQQT